MVLTYVAMTILTAGVIHSANRVTGTRVPYTVVSSALWPAWWLRWMFVEEA